HSQTPSGYVGKVEILTAELGYMLLPAREIVAQQQIEDLAGALCVLRHDPDEPARLGVHRRQPHHVRVVLAQALGTVYRDLGAAYALQYLRLLALGISKPCLAARFY